MKITESMVSLMNAFSIMAKFKDSKDELRELYKQGMMELGNLSKEQVMNPEQACSVTDFFRDVIRNEEARIDNTVSASVK